MAPAKVLVTGATGFVGGAAAARLLQTRPSCSLVLLVRAESQAHALQRAERSLLRFDEDGSLVNALDRCTVLPGDLTSTHTLADPLLDDVTHVLHAAANTSLLSVRGARRTNILGTLTLAHRMRRVANLRRFLHVGTAYLCGASPPAVVHEDDFPRSDTRHLVEYTSSKAEAELLLDNTAPELPLVIARPSVVVGHTRLGCGPSASLFWYYRTLALLRRTPFPTHARRDIVPVDYVADALLLLLLEPHLAHRRYHISAGEISSASWNDIARAFRRAWREPSGEECRPVDIATLRGDRDRLRACLGPGDEERLLQALEVFFRLGASGVEVFDNQRLLDEGMPPPPAFPSYLSTCLALPPGRSVYEQLADDD